MKILSLNNSFRLHRFAGTVWLLFAIIFSFSSCDKHSSPRKVERFLTEGRWVISNAIIDNENIIELYNSYEFRFDSSDNIQVIGAPTITGKWSVSAQRNPTAISFTFTPFEPFDQLNSDWTFTLCTEEQMELEQDGSGTKDYLVLKKIL